MRNEITELSFDEIDAVNGAGFFSFLGGVASTVWRAIESIPININGIEISDGNPDT